MKYILFIGSRLGFEALNTLLELNCKLIHVFIEQEHEHEHEKYYLRSTEVCKKFDVQCSLNPTNKTIIEVINNNPYDYVMSFGYRKMIKESVIEKAKIAAFGTHFSPLPRYRGFAPLNWVLINGEEETAVNLFYLDEKVDNGDIIACRKVLINYSDDIKSLYERCIVEFTMMMKDTIPNIERNCFKAEPQDESKASYTCARNPEDGLIDWNWDSRKIYNYVRALTYPFPGAYTHIKGEKLIVWSCEEYDIPKYENIIIGKIVKIIKNEGVVVLCGKGAIKIKKVQIDERERTSADNYISSMRQTLGK